MACLTNPINQASANNFPIWITLIRNEVTSSQRSVWLDRFIVGFLGVSSELSVFIPQKATAVDIKLFSRFTHTLLYIECLGLGLWVKFIASNIVTNIVTSPTAPGPEDDCAGEDQQQL
jgi:hypothetical protein